MPVYEYTALNEKGNQRKGFIDAAGVAAARQKLREDGVYPTEINLAAEKKEDTATSILSMNLFARVPAKDCSRIYPAALHAFGCGNSARSFSFRLVNQTKNLLFKKSLAQIREQVNEGKSLTESMSHFPRIFPQLYINMVKAGEASGTINLVLEKLADFSENQQTLNNKIRAALTYPIVMFFIGCIIVFILMTFVMPKITGIFSEMHQALPFITLALIAVSNFLKSFWWLVLLAIVAAIITVKYLIGNTAGGKRAWDNIKLKSPLFGAINRKIAIARFCRTLATLLQSGVPLLTALGVVRNVVNNDLIGEAMKRRAKMWKRDKVSPYLSRKAASFRRWLLK